MVYYDEFHAIFSARNIVKARILKDIQSGALNAPCLEWKAAVVETAIGSAPRVFVMSALIDAVVAELGSRVNSTPEMLARISELAAKNLDNAWLLPSVAIEGKNVLPWGYEMEDSWVRNGRPAITASAGLRFLRNRFLETIIPAPACFQNEAGESVLLNNVVEKVLVEGVVPCSGDVNVRGQWMKRLYVIPAASIRWSSTLWYSEKEIQAASQAGLGFLKSMTPSEVEADAQKAAADCAEFIAPDLFVEVRKAGLHKHAMMNLVARDALSAAKEIIASDMFANAISAINVIGSQLPAEDWPIPDNLRDTALSERAIQGLMWLCVDGNPADIGWTHAPDSPNDRLSLMLAIMALVETGACVRYLSLSIGQSTGQHWPAIMTALAAYKHGCELDRGVSFDGWHRFALWVPDVDRANFHLDNVQRWYQDNAAIFAEHRGAEAMTENQLLAVGRKSNIQPLKVSQEVGTGAIIS